jgi:YVTN family beta-propeller protein
MGVIATAVVVAVLDVAVWFAVHDGTPAAAARPGGANMVAVIDASSRHVVDNVPVGGSPTLIASGFGGAWVLNKGEGTLTHIDEATRRVVATVPLDVAASDLTVGVGGVWLVGRARGGTPQPLETAALERIDPRTDRVNRRLQTQVGAFVMAAGGSTIWSTGLLPGMVRGAARSDPRTGATREVDIEIYGDLIAANSEAAYWVGSTASRVARVSTRTGLLTASMPLASDRSLAAGRVPPNPTGVVVGGGALWISTVDGTVLRVDPQLRGLVASIPACKNSLAIAYGEAAVWVACGDGSVVRIDPKTDQADPPIHVGGLPRGIAVGGGQVWVTLN